MMHVSALVRLSAAGLCAVLLSGCQSQPTQNQPQAAAQPQASAIPPAAPSLEDLRNATYQRVEEAGGPVTLAGGRWEGKPLVEGGASVPTVTLVRDFRLSGDLDGNGREEAVVLLGGNAGGTGETIYLAVVGRGPNGLENLATAPIGDRVQVRDARVDGRRVVLDVVQAGENDAMCCPGDLVTRGWELASGGLVEGAASKTGRLSLDVLAGTEWTLQSWLWDESAPAAPEVTLKLDGGRFVGNAGCNQYFAPVKPGNQPGDIAVGPAGATRKMCGPAEMEVEARFLKQLGAVRQMRFVGGQLALNFDQDGSFGTMLFEPRRP